MAKLKNFTTKNILFFSIVSILALVIISIKVYSTFAGTVISTAGINCEKNHAYLNPGLDCGAFVDKAEKIEKLQRTLTDMVGEFEQSGQADKIGVFTRDMATQRFAGVNENDVFYMASLLKVPLAVAYYKYAEVTPDVMNYEIKYSGAPNLYYEQNMEPQEKLSAGKSYLVNDLLRRALIYSDNTAAEILAEKLPSNFLDDILTALNLRFKNDGTREDLVTPKTYAGIFRTLYNSTYLTQDYSNQLLSILSESSYKDGAIAQLPSGTKVSHKFGERTQYDAAGNLEYRQLHDCGLVYAPNKDTYSFCIMTRGQDFEKLQNIIQDISLAIYKGFNP